MTGRWLRFLEDAGAVTDESGRVSHFGNPSRELRVATRGSVIVDLSHFGLIRARGPDAAKFLQGQLTNDVNQVDAGHGQLSGLCTPKGRLLAILRIFLRAESYFLLLPSPLTAPTLERLRKYVLMSKVELVDDSEALVGVGLSGPHCEKELEQLVEPVPAAVNDSVQANDMTVIRTAAIQPRFEIYGPTEVMEKTWARLDVRAAPVGAAAWTLLDVLAGVPAVYPQTVDEFVPQTVNLDLLGGISFNKGCYTGQEIVARVHYRGTVKRRMYLAHCDAAEAPRPGDAVRTAGSDQAIGRVVSAAPDPDGGHLLLTSVTTGLTDLRLGQPTGPALELRDLPYLRAGAD